MEQLATLTEEPKGVFIQTFGCQMNQYDSAKMLEQLRRENYLPVDSPGQADLILVNTCAIREKSEHKVYSLLGTLGGIKREHPDVMIGVGGCVSQQRGAEILERVREVDMVFGTDHLFGLPEMIRAVREGRRVVRTGWREHQGRVENFIPDFGAATGSGGSVSAGLAITKGCNNFCTFCVVPYTRGREVSREPDNILAEAEALIGNGAREITLLGQNVNSYRAGGVTFVDLLQRLNAMAGLHRIRYTSPHPKDLNEELIQAHAELPKLCESIHLPFQSGSNRILKAMRRNHTIEVYQGKIADIRRKVPGMAISTDIIVGFPGEKERDFQDTLAVMREVRFHHLYAFKFSPRPDTPAADYAGQVPEAVRAERLARLFALHEEIVGTDTLKLVGSRQEVLVEGPRPRMPGAVTGRTRGFKSVAVLDSRRDSGDLIQVNILAARKFSLVGRETDLGTE